MRAQHLLLLVLLLLGLLAPSGWVFAAEPATAQSAVRYTLSHGGRERSYWLWLPPRAAATRTALVLVLHGGGGNGEHAARTTGFTAKAQREGFAVVYPEGSARAQRMLTWNARHCCGYAMQERVDDVGFIATLIDELIASRGIDPQRVYVTGMSNGAMLAHRLGAELSTRIAAIAPVMGGLFGDEPRPTSIVSALLINGARDRSVPLAGGASGGVFARAWDGTPLLPAAEQSRFWSAANGCREAQREIAQGAVQVRTAACRPGVAVQAYVLPDSGHAWPGGERGSAFGDPPSSAMTATDVIWAFFAAHPKTT